MAVAQTVPEAIARHARYKGGELAHRNLMAGMMDAVPAMIQFMLQVPGAEKADYSSLEGISYGASPISEKVLTTAGTTPEAGADCEVCFERLRDSPKIRAARRSFDPRRCDTWRGDAT